VVAGSRSFTTNDSATPRRAAPGAGHGIAAFHTRACPSGHRGGPVAHLVAAGPSGPAVVSGGGPREKQRLRPRHHRPAGAATRAAPRASTTRRNAPCDRQRASAISAVAASDASLSPPARRRHRTRGRAPPRAARCRSWSRSRRGQARQVSNVVRRLHRDVVGLAPGEALIVIVCSVPATAGAGSPVTAVAEAKCGS